MVKYLTTLCSIRARVFQKHFTAAFNMHNSNLFTPSFTR
jgi:hypothetical protein